MTWRDLWQTAATNVRALFGAQPPAPPPLRVRVAQARALPGPVETRVLTVAHAQPLDTAAPDIAPDETVAYAPDDVPAHDPPVATPEAARPEDRTTDDAHDADDLTGDAPQADNSADELLALLESLLFVAAEPVAPAQLAQALDSDEATITDLLARLDAAYRLPGRGLRLQQLGGKVQLVTAPGAAPVIERFLNLDTGTRLSGPALETLAVIAYRQPVTRIQIEAVRGVDCAGVLRSLSQRGLINEVGRQETVGRPILYGVTELFMQHFGLLGLKDLPPLAEADADRLHTALLHHDDVGPDPSDPITTAG